MEPRVPSPSLSLSCSTGSVSLSTLNPPERSTSQKCFIPKFTFISQVKGHDNFKYFIDVDRRKETR